MTNTEIKTATIETLQARICDVAAGKLSAQGFVAAYVLDGHTEEAARDLLTKGIQAFNAAIEQYERAQKLARLRAHVAANREAGRPCYEGLKSHEIGTLSGATMFGDNFEAFPSESEWSLWVD